MLDIAKIKALGGFNIILADPAWTYKDKALAGNRGAGCKYDLMNDQDIYNLPVKEIAAKDSVLCLWATWPKIQEALNTIPAWGFTYKTVAFNWIKTYPKSTHKYFIGMGRWSRSNSEVCLLATRGKPKRQSAGVSQIIETFEDFEGEDLISPIRKHSQKPDEVRERIVQLCGDLPRVELFARDKKDGWLVWGNELTSDITLE